MIAFPEMLVPAAREAGIETPEDPENYNSEDFIRWHIFLILQLGAPMSSPSAYWDNAKVIATIPEDKLRIITVAEIVEMGFSAGYPP